MVWYQYGMVCCGIIWCGMGLLKYLLGEKIELIKLYIINEVKFSH
jgi:hypothetical protein